VADRGGVAVVWDSWHPIGVRNEIVHAFLADDRAITESREGDHYGICVARLWERRRLREGSHDDTYLVLEELVERVEEAFALLRPLRQVVTGVNKFVVDLIRGNNPSTVKCLLEMGPCPLEDIPGVNPSPKVDDCASIYGEEGPLGHATIRVSCA